MAELHDALGVSPDADEATIQKAYRKRAKKAHPDAGGDPEDFKRLTGAYLVLKDPARRAHYERTGETENMGGDRIRQEALSLLGQAIAQALEDPKADHTDFAKVIRANITQANAELAKAIKEHRKRKEKLERNARRWRLKKGADSGPDVIAQITQSQIVGAEMMVARCEHEIEVRAAVAEILDGYEYEHDPKAAPSMTYQELKLDPAAFFKSAGYTSGGWR